MMYETSPLRAHTYTTLESGSCFKIMSANSNGNDLNGSILTCRSCRADSFASIASKRCGLFSYGPNSSCSSVPAWFDVFLKRLAADVRLFLFHHLSQSVSVRNCTSPSPHQFSPSTAISVPPLNILSHSRSAIS